MDIEEGLDKLLLGRYDEALAVFQGCPPSPQAEKLCQVALTFIETAEYAAELAKGNLSITPFEPPNHLTAELDKLRMKLKRLSRQLLMVSTGYPVSSIDDLGDLSAGLNFLVGQASARKERAEYDFDRDMETGLLNRRAFLRGIYELLQAQPHKVGVLLCCGLDNIRYVNEAYGYACGDLYINKVVKVLSGGKQGLCLLARTGGSEFSIYAHGFENVEEARESVWGYFKTLLNTRVELLHGSVKVRVSCGMSVYPHDAATSDVLMDYASCAMYDAREHNPGTVVRFHPEIYRTKANLFIRQERLNELIEGRLLHFAFQPVVRLGDGEVVGYEALMRPKTVAFSGPLDILAMAESLGKLPQLERVTFELIFEWVSRNSKKLGGKKIFFNTISAQYLDVLELRDIHPDYEAISKKMVFELLETATIEDGMMQKINAFRRDVATQIAIDDFGCGHSNALRLIGISPDILKIDKFFIKNIHMGPTPKTELLSNILDYCRAKGIHSLAEGVETSDQLRGVMNMGFDYAQGYYLGRPSWQLAGIDPRVRSEIMAFVARNA